MNEPVVPSEGNQGVREDRGGTPSSVAPPLVAAGARELVDFYEGFLSRTYQGVHGRLAQEIAGAGLWLQALHATALAEADREVLGTVSASIHEAMRSVRILMTELRPLAYEDASLAVCLSHLGECIGQEGSSQVVLTVRGIEPTLPREFKLAVSRLVCELMRQLRGGPFERASGDMVLQDHEIQIRAHLHRPSTHEAAVATASWWSETEDRLHGLLDLLRVVCHRSTSVSTEPPATALSSATAFSPPVPDHIEELLELTIPLPGSTRVLES